MQQTFDFELTASVGNIVGLLLTGAKVTGEAVVGAAVAKVAAVGAKLTGAAVVGATEIGADVVGSLLSVLVDASVGAGVIFVDIVVEVAVGG